MLDNKFKLNKSQRSRRLCNQLTNSRREYDRNYQQTIGYYHKHVEQNLLSRGVPLKLRPEFLDFRSVQQDSRVEEGIIHTPYILAFSRTSLCKYGIGIIIHMIIRNFSFFHNMSVKKSVLSTRRIASCVNFAIILSNARLEA